MLFPKIIEYQPYSICNANCTYCPVGHLNRKNKHKGYTMNRDVFNNLVEQFKGKEVIRISPHMNCEPLLSADLEEQFKIWKEFHPYAEIALSTNAVFLTNERFRSLSESGLDTLELHYMGVNKVYHENAMNTNFEKVKKNIENVLEFKKNQKINNTKIVIFSHRLKGASLNDWNEFANKWQNKGAIIEFGPLWNRAGWYGKEFDKKRKGLLKSTHPHPCSKPWDQLAIDANGEVLLCSLDYKNIVKIGNINKTSIENIWNSKVMKKYQNSQNDPNKLKDLDLCNKCIRGGRYLIDGKKLTKMVTNKSNNQISKFLYKQYLNIMDFF